MPRAPLECKIYVGDLPRDASEKELERAFSYYGPLRNVWVARNPPGFAFIEFEDPRDADDAVRGLDGTNVCGGRIRCEHSTGKARPKPWQQQPQRSSSGGRGPPRTRKAFNPDDRCYECGERGHYAYDCSRLKRRGGRRSRSRSRSRSYERKRSYSRSRSRSAGRDRSRSPRGRYRTRSRSPRSRSRSVSRPRSNDRGASRDRSRSRSRSVSRPAASPRAVSPARNGGGGGDDE